MKERDLKEAISDRLLLLYLLFKIRKKGQSVSGDTKLQKLLYEIEQRMYRNRYKGLNYNFVRWDFGPFSQEVYVDSADLEKTGFLKRHSDKSIGISDSGIRLIEMMQKDLKGDKVLEEYFDRVINEFGPYKGKGIKAAIYTSPKVGERKPIRETTKAEILLKKLDTSEAMKSFWINDRWFETLRIIFDPTFSLKVKKGLQALKEEEGKPFIPVTE